MLLFTPVKTESESKPLEKGRALFCQVHHAYICIQLRELTGSQVISLFRTVIQSKQWMFAFKPPEQATQNLLISKAGFKTMVEKAHYFLILMFLQGSTKC